MIMCRTLGEPIDNTLFPTNESLSCYERYSVEKPKRLTNNVFHEPMPSQFLIKNEDLFFLGGY